jgi:hypothetical protein
VRLLSKQSLEQLNGSPTKGGGSSSSANGGGVDAKKGEPTLAEVAVSIAAYSFCSSMMVVANWFAIRSFKNSAVVTQVQFVFATLTCLVLG